MNARMARVIKENGMADPGQDPRGAPDVDPLWTILDMTPSGRDVTWYPKLEYTGLTTIE